MNGSDTAALIAALRTRSGFAADAVAPARVASYLALRAREIGVVGEEAAASRILTDAAEYARIESHFAPPETWLFRYPESFAYLCARAQSRGARGVRALVVGAGGWCEPCSVAAALLDGVGDANASRVSVEAVDRSATVFAGPPLFRGMDLRGGIPAFAARFFEPDGDALRPTRDLTRVVRARTLSAEAVVDECRRAGARFDVIVFRNVAIYLDAPARNALFAALAELLADDGVMLVGHAECTAAAAATGLSPDPAAGAFALVRARAAADPKGAGEPATGARPTPARVAPQISAMPASQGAWIDERREPTSARRGPTTARREPTTARREPTSARREPGDESRARDAIAARPADAGLHLALARILEAHGDRDGARDAVGRALYLDRNHEDALLLAAQLAAARGDEAEAAHLRARALRVHLDRMRAEGSA